MMAEDPNVVRNGSYTRPYYTVATLPAASGQQGAPAFVTDAVASPYSNYGQVAVGGGTIRTRVQSDGTFWRYAP